MLDERKLDVLRAIVEDYVSTQEPVGSKSLVDRHHLGVSPATVRNDMAVLEDEGFITQPHTSAGRIPTDKGYRLFVDKLTTVKPLTPAEKRAISTFLEGAHDLDDVVQRTVRMLAQLTRQVAIVQYPSLSRSTVRHVEVVPLAPNRVLLVLISSSGRVAQRMAELSGDVDEAMVADLRARLNAATSGKRLAEASDGLAHLADAFAVEDRAIVSEVVDTLVETISDEHTDDRLAIGGTHNLSRFGDDFEHSIKPMLEVLEEHVVLLKLLGEASSPSMLTVRIGHEQPYQELSSTSVVATGYGPGPEALATLGIMGPTRMDYPGTMAAVRAVARYVSNVLDET